MDPITHGFTGALLSRAFSPRHKNILLILIIASLLPDIDYITRFLGADIFLRYHRGITHGIGAMVLTPLVIGTVARSLTGEGFLYYTGAGFLGYSLHLLMDLTTQYPIRILSPLDWYGYSLDLAFIVDPYVSGAVLLGLLLSMRKKAKRRLIVAVVLLFLIVYMGVRFYLKNQAEAYLRTQLDEYHYRLCPLPNDFLRWWFVVKSGNTYKVGFVDLFTRSVCIKKEFTYSEARPEIKETKTLRTVRNFLYFAKAPYAEFVKKGGGALVKWYELSYYFLPGEHFVAIIEFDRLGRVTREEFRF
jgi:inner membrane protein